MSKLDSLLDRDRVLAFAGERFLERGQRYAAEGHVRAIDEDDSAIAGIVSGTLDYELRIRETQPRASIRRARRASGRSSPYPAASPGSVSRPALRR